MKSYTSSPSGIPRGIKDFMCSGRGNNKLTHNSCNGDKIESWGRSGPHGAPPESRMQVLQTWDSQISHFGGELECFQDKQLFILRDGQCTDT